MIGAGPAGLAAALTAAEAGHDVVVFEASDTVGGMAGSFEVAGIRVDHGSHRLHAATDPVFLQRLTDLLGPDLQARERNGRIRLRDRWVAFPLRPGSLVRQLPPGFGVRVAVESIVGPVRARAGRSIGFVGDVSRRLGPTVTDEFYRPYAAKLYGVDPGELTAELARRRVSASSPIDVLTKAFRARRPDGRTFYYPRRGYGQVSEALADAAAAAGADIRLRSPVTRLVASPGSPPTIESGSSASPARSVELGSSASPAWPVGSGSSASCVSPVGSGSSASCVSPVGSGSSSSSAWPVGSAASSGRSAVSSTSVTEVDVVASTMPVPTLVDVLDPPVDQAVAAAARALRTRAMVLVYLVVPRPRYTPFDAHYFPSLDTSISRLSEPKNYRDGDDPGDRTVLCAELACWLGDEIWSASTHDLTARVVTDLARVGLPDPKPVDTVVRRLPAVYPVYEEATAAARAVVDRWLGGIPGVLSFGRQGLGVPDNLHHVIDMGSAAASAIEPGGIDRGRWTDALRRFESNVVVD